MKRSGDILSALTAESIGRVAFEEVARGEITFSSFSLEIVRDAVAASMLHLLQSFFGDISPNSKIFPKSLFPKRKI